METISPKLKSIERMYETIDDLDLDLTKNVSFKNGKGIDKALMVLESVGKFLTFATSFAIMAAVGSVVNTLCLPILLPMLLLNIPPYHLFPAFYLCELITDEVKFLIGTLSEKKMEEMISKGKFEIEAHKESMKKNKTMLKKIQGKIELLEKDIPKEKEKLSSNNIQLQLEDLLERKWSKLNGKMLNAQISQAKTERVINNLESPREYAGMNTYRHLILNH
jgi:hypothetical protein